MPDRSIPPVTRSLDNLVLPKPQLSILDNEMPVYGINMGTQDVLKLEIVFHAGRPYEHKQMVSRATGSMLREGSKHFTAPEIAEKLDYYGCSLSTPSNLDTINVVLYSLTKHFDKILPVLAGLLESPAFPQKELEAFIARNQQRLQVELTKSDVVAYRKITEYIFGSEHPYGYNSFPETYAALQRNDLVQHFESFLTSGNGQIFVSGKVDQRVLDLINQYLSPAIRKGPAGTAHPQWEERSPGKIKAHHPDTVQTAIRIGKRLFNRQHPDYPGLYVLNTILGGYFGSRLMANIREEKGYTYNIYSVIDTMHFDGCFYLGTEVGNDFVADTLSEIYSEMDQLQQYPVEEEELEMVRNYLLGNFLTMLDGPFNVADLIKTLVTEDVPLSHFDDLTQTVKTITAEELLELARKYFQPDELWEVVVGNLG